MRTSWPHFSERELACRCSHASCPRHGMDSSYMARLERLRGALDFPLPVISPYRCPAHNQAVSSTGANGPHTTGQATDIRIVGDRAFALIALAAELGFTGIGVKQHGPHDRRFIHLDDLTRPGYPRPWIWSYP